MTASRARALFCLCILCFGLIWFWGLGHRPLFTTDEGRYAEIPREMLASGNWVTPRLDGLRYFEKPPLQYWTTAAAYGLFGVHDWVARLWTALSGFLTVLFAGFAAARLYGRRVGWLAAAALAGSFYFGFMAHFNTLDAGLAFTMSLTLFGFLLARKSPARSRAELGWMLVAYGGAALAVLSKGLIGIILPGAVLVIYILVKRDFALIRRLRLLPGLALFFAMTLPWFVAVSLNNHDFLYQFFMVQQFLRFLTPAQHRPGPWWYFLPLLVLAVLPWLASAARGLVRPVRSLAQRGEFDAAAFLWLWVVFIFLFYSVSHSKLPSYILPVIPALAVLIGRELSRARTLPWIAAGLSVLVGAAVIALGIAAPGFVKGTDPAILHAFLPWVIAAGALVLAMTVAAILLRKRTLPVPSPLAGEGESLPRARSGDEGSSREAAGNRSYHPHPNPLPSRERECEIPSPLAGEGEDEGGSRAAAENRSYHPHPNPLPSREREFDGSLFLRKRALAAVVLVAVAWLVATRLVMLGGAAFGPEFSTQSLAAAVARYNRLDVPVYSVGGYQQTLPYYLRRKVIIVAYQGEFKFGIEHARKPLADRYLPTLAAFAARWRSGGEALAFVPRENLDKVQALDIHYRVVAENPRWVALVPAP